MSTGTPTAPRDKIATQLLEAKLIDEAGLARAKEIQKKDGGDKK